MLQIVILLQIYSHVTMVNMQTCNAVCPYTPLYIQQALDSWACIGVMWLYGRIRACNDSLCVLGHGQAAENCINCVYNYDNLTIMQFMLKQINVFVMQSYYRVINIMQITFIFVWITLDELVSYPQNVEKYVDKCVDNFFVLLKLIQNIEQK